MQPDAVEQFDAYRAELDAMHVLTPAHGAMLALLAETTNRRAELSHLVFASPPLVKGARSDREIIQNVAWLMWRRAVAVERSLLVEFGLSPASRASMRFGWHEPFDERDALLSPSYYP